MIYSNNSLLKNLIRTIISMKKVILLLVFAFLLVHAQAQKKQNVYYLKNNGKFVNIKDSADYVRVIQEPDSGEVNYNLLEFYVDGKQKKLGKVSAFDPNLVFEGTIVSYNKAGRRKNSLSYEKGKLIGMAYYYYDNGKIHKQVEYLKSGFTPEIDQMIGINSDFTHNILGAVSSKLIYYVDTLGKVIIENGNGHLVETTKTKLGERVEEGDYRDGLREGVWIGRGDSENHTYKETYQQGKLVEGESILDNIKYPYTTLMSPPEYRGGKEGWRDYLSRTIKYPLEAAEQGISGLVIIGFVVDKDGKIEDAKPIKSLHPSLDKEASRMLSYSHKWIPAKMRGVPVRVRYTQPIRFTLPRH